MRTEQISDILDDMGSLLEIKGENPFKCRAYHNAADTLRGVVGDVSSLVADGSLTELPGIGASMFAKIAQLATSGQCTEYESLRREVPPGLLDLLRIQGLGAKRIKALRDSLGICGIADLKKSAESGEVAKIKGFGAKTQAKILEGLEFLDQTGSRMLQSTAFRLASPILVAANDHPDVIRASICGSLRRRAETIGDLDILLATDHPRKVLDSLASRPEVVAVLAHGDTKLSVRLSEGAQCDIRAVNDEQYPFALNYFTGSKAHNIAMRKRAIARGLKLSEYGLVDEAGKPTPCKDEPEIYQALGLAYVPPELREDSGEFALAEAEAIPRLIELDDLKGTFHCHTDYSDGANTLEQMAQAAMDRGWGYLGIADHSRSAAYAGGLSVEKLKRQWDEIDALNERFGGKFKLLKGIECDILADGSMDYPDSILSEFDYVVASIHSGFGLERSAQTARLIRAAENPYVTMLGHPTGRLLLARPGYDVDLEAVILACGRTGTMIEINASPYRLDLDTDSARFAKRCGVMISINPDAHSTAGLDDVFFGTGVARRAGLEAKDVLNGFGIGDIMKLIKRKLPSL